MQSSSFLIVVLGYLAFGISAIIWISKRKKAGKKISLKAKIIIAVVFLSSSSVLLSMIELSPAPETSAPVESTTYYVKSGGANVRDCPSISCKVLDTLSPNTKLTFPGDLFDKYPDWVEVTFPDGGKGYVSKTVLSSEPSSESPIESPSQGSGIALGEGDFEPLIVGYSYGFSFCVPESARSGATCGGLAGDTQSPVGGSPPYSLMKGSGFFPPGMSLELNGWFSGSPTTEGTYNFQICAKDLQMNQGCQNYTIVVVKEETLSPTTDAVFPPSVADTPLSLEITGGTCRFIRYQDIDADGSVFGKIVTVEITGTAGGPIRSFITYSSSRDIYEQYGLEDSWTKLEASWPEDYGRPTREIGYPAVTEWKYTINNGMVVDEGKKGFVWLRMATEESGGYPEIEKEIRVDCP